MVESKPDWNGKKQTKIEYKQKPMTKDLAKNV